MCDRVFSSLVTPHRTIKDALYDNEVYECFRTTLARAKKVVRGAGAAETKTAMDEFEQLMDRIHSQANGEEVEGEEGGALDLDDVAVALQALDMEDGEDGEGQFYVCLCWLKTLGVPSKFKY